MNVSKFWTTERIALVEQRWGEGLTCQAIAEEIGDGCTKNAIIGKVRRLDLEMRLPPPPPAPRPRDPFDGLAPSDCRWPIGHPGELEFHFCADRALPGKPYCDKHCARAFILPARSKTLSDGWSPERKAKHSARMRARHLAAAE